MNRRVVPSPDLLATPSPEGWEAALTSTSLAIQLQVVQRTEEVATRGEVINGGFGCVLDGTKEADGRLTTLLSWDVNNGVCRRSWSGNKYAYETIQRAMKDDPALLVTLPNEADEQLLKKVLAGRKL
ncbi:hypothetical protein HPB51_011805 [Rhipicephalus microplus]|uniref:Urocanase C-terminal domain-containing protein n=1 Tax=Rhipicephalus microplus TaxID=6941 RepID=A0A9J6DGA0_RHIMP|nr:hypothetical protein HPB51_011805 [Rhipicephalus microplus]